MLPSLLGNQSQATGITLILVAATCWAIAGGVGGVLIEKGWDPIVVSFYRGALTLLFAIFWLLLSTKRRGLACRQLWMWSALAGAGVAGAFSFYFAGMKTGNVAIAATLLYSAPVFVFIAEYLSGRERMTLKNVLGLFLVIAGVALLSGLFFQSATGIGMSAVALGLLSGACYALFIFGFQKAGTFGNTPVVMTAAFAVETALLAALAGAGIWPTVMQPIDAGLILVLGVLGGGVSFLFYIVGLKNSSARAAAVLGMAEPLTAASFGFVVLSQSLSPQQILGAGILLATVTWLQRRPSQ